MPKYDPDYFEEKFPNLFQEMKKENTKSVQIDGVRTNSKEGKKATKPDRSSGPSIVDFIRLCDTEEEAVEIINHYEDENKIGHEYAKKLRNQITRKGLRSFGSKREPGDYKSTK